MNYKNCEVVVFFSGGINSYYQVKQWQKPFEELNKKHKVLYIVTDYEAYLEYIKEQTLEVIYLEEFTDLIEFYQNNEIPITLYINNSLRNFQCVRYSRGYHIHINHGESEKESMRSNQSQSYDYIFTVGQRGIDRYKEYLLNFREEKFIQVGRPQLDFINKMSFTNENKKVILYAPTWEATHDSMNYTSVPVFGVRLVNQIIENENYILIYKPHAALGSRNLPAKIANDEIKTIIENSENAYYMESESIHDIFTLADYTFFDNTSVMIDYLHMNKPAAYMEIIEDQSVRGLAKAFKTINKENFEKTMEILSDELEKDSNKGQREEVKHHYLGNYDQGESTEKFINEITKLIDQRNKRIVNILK